jgi:hypothetical protein
MNKFNKLVKVNNGKANHMAELKTNGLGVTFLFTYCGSGEGKSASAFYEIPAEVNENTLTCKKCLKKYLSEK